MGLKPSSTMVEVWRNKNTVKDVVRRGYDAIVAEGWYLDHKEVTCESAYHNELNLRLNPQEAGRLKGGEAAMWTEWVESNQLTQTIFPRLMAVAEHLWSPSTATRSYRGQEGRLQRMIGRLNNRGVNSSPMAQCDHFKSNNNPYEDVGFDRNMVYAIQLGEGSNPTSWQQLRFPELY